MPTAYVVVLLLLVTCIGVARLVLPALPSRRVSVRLHRVDVVLSLLGVLGLTFHCGAMFYRSAVQLLPGTNSAVSNINSLGPVSVVAFTVPAALLIVGLRRIRPPALALIVLALGAVGSTMYDGGPLTAHLTAIFATIALLAVCAATLIEGPRIGWQIGADTP